MRLHKLWKSNQIPPITLINVNHHKSGLTKIINQTLTVPICYLHQKLYTATPSN